MNFRASHTPRTNDVAVLNFTRGGSEPAIPYGSLCFGTTCPLFRSGVLWRKFDSITQSLEARRSSISYRRRIFDYSAWRSLCVDHPQSSFTVFTVAPTDSDANRMTRSLTHRILHLHSLPAVWRPSIPSETRGNGAIYLCGPDTY